MLRVFPAAPVLTLLITLYDVPFSTKLALPVGTPGKLMEAPGPMFNPNRLPVPEEVLILSVDNVPAKLMLALTLTLLAAVSVKLLLEDVVTTSLTLTLPAVPLAPAEDIIVTLPVARFVDSTAPVMSPPLAATVKSVGSISQVPLLPCGAWVVMRAVSATRTCAALVSM